MTSAECPECDVVLRDGSTIHVREERPDDVERVAAFYDRLSKESSYRRFFTMSRARPRLPPGAPPESRFVLLGELRGNVVAVAEYVVLEPDGTRAEVAFAIADMLQGRGVATRLLELLAEHAREDGVQTFVAQVLGTNRTMMSVFRDSGFDVEQRVRDDVYEVSVSLHPSLRFTRRAGDRAEIAAVASMRPFFAPRAVAVVGASRNAAGVGAQVFRKVRESGFRGPVHPVNPHDTMIDGVPCVPSVTKIDGPVDLAIVVVPAPHVEGVVDDCIAKKIPALVVISAGFAETGAEGFAREAALVEKVRDAGLRMIGPNCLGIMNTDPDVRLNAIFARRLPAVGDMAFACQGGSLGLAILDYVSRLHIGISNFVSLGNKADVSSNDLVQLWGADPRTRVILLYLESFGNPRTFARLARRVGRDKPIVAVKAGRSLAAPRPTPSHLGALATDDAVVDGLFRQAGIIRTRTVGELFDVATLLSRQPLPKGGRVAILTNSGGPGTLAADACVAEGLELCGLTDTTVATLRATLPAGARVANPVDMLVSAPAQHYRIASEALLADDHVDSLLVIHTPPFVSDPAEVASAIDAAASRSPKPVLAVFMAAGEMPPALGRLPWFSFPEPAVTALAHVVAYSRWKSQPLADVETFADVDARRVRAAVEMALARGGGWLTTAEAQSLLLAAGIPAARAAFVCSADDAALASLEIGLPVALKAAGPSIVHRGEIDGVRLSLASEDAARRAYEELSARLGARMSGAIVQEMVPAGIAGVEMTVGALEHPSFGPVIALGLALGTTTLRAPQMTFRLQPITGPDAAAMIDEVKGCPPALKEMLLRVSALLELCPEIHELEIDPVRSSVGGAKAVDVRVRVKPLTARPPSRRIRY
jgi:acyl-CoA synthetase (NDP forming)/RimJ/RimL family protein N-acetyltransferase